LYSKIRPASVPISPAFIGYLFSLSFTHDTAL
jgi:hypothetical protein